MDATSPEPAHPESARPTAGHPEPASSPAMGQAMGQAMGPAHYGAMGVVVLIWAFNFVVGKVGLAQIPPLLLMGLRFAVAAAALSPFLVRPLGVPFAPVALLSFTLGGLHFSLMFAGLAGMDAGPAAIAVQLFVPFSAILAAIVFRDRLTRVQVGGMVLAFLGVYVLAGEPVRPPDPAALSMVVGAAFMMAVATMQIKRLGPVNIFRLNAWVALLAAPQLFLASWLLEDGQGAALANADWRGWGAVAYMGLGVTVVSHSLWYKLVARFPVNRVAPLTLLAPVLAVILASVFLDEPLTARIAVGGLTTLLGVAVIQFVHLRADGAAARAAKAAQVAEAGPPAP